MSGEETENGQGQEQQSTRRSGDWMPRPDPTKLTTEQLNREILNLKELMLLRVESIEKYIASFEGNTLLRRTEVEKQIDHLRGFIGSRLDGMDKAAELLQKILDNLPLRIDEKLTALSNIFNEKVIAIESKFDEKFTSIQTQFRERDVRTQETNQSSKVAVDAALSAAKEAVAAQTASSDRAIAKSETATMKQIEQMGMLITTQANGFEGKISDMKDRVGRTERELAEIGGRGIRAGESKRTGEWGLGVTIAIISSAVSAILGVVGIFVGLYLRK